MRVALAVLLVASGVWIGARIVAGTFTFMPRRWKQ